MLTYPSRDDLCYAAGIFDGEGCIMIQKAKPVAYWLTVRVGTTDLELLTWLKVRWGGSVSRTRFRLQRKPSAEWQLINKAAGQFLRSVLPFLQTKRPQAELALKFLGDRQDWRGMRHPPTEELALREGYHLAMREAKR